eukprot:14864816-Alexandrium_andersonii.AAC.1
MQSREQAMQGEETWEVGPLPIAKECTHRGSEVLVLRAFPQEVRQSRIIEATCPTPGVGFETRLHRLKRCP